MYICIYIYTGLLHRFYQNYRVEKLQKVVQKMPATSHDASHIGFPVFRPSFSSPGELGGKKTLKESPPLQGHKKSLIH